MYCGGDVTLTLTLSLKGEGLIEGGDLCIAAAMSPSP